MALKAWGKPTLHIDPSASLDTAAKPRNHQKIHHSKYGEGGEQSTLDKPTSSTRIIKLTD
jgi:hypothetical protein